MQDILLNENNELKINKTNGKTDLSVGDATLQTAELIIGAFMGEFKNTAMFGGNAKYHITGTPNPFWTGEVKKQLKVALVPVKDITLNGTNIIVEINN